MNGHSSHSHHKYPSPFQSQLVTVAEVDCLTNERLCALLGVTGGNYYYAAGQVEEGKGVVSYQEETKSNSSS